MNDNPVQTTMPAAPAEQALIAGKGLAYYWQTVRWFVVALVVLAIINSTFRISPWGRYVATVLIAVALAWLLARRGRDSLIGAAVAGTMMGVLAGGTLAIFDIIWYHQWWYILNVVRMPCILGGISMAVGCAGYLVFRNSIHKRERSDTKGGGIYGRTKTT